MDKQSQSAIGLIDESIKGNLRIRLHQFRANDGSLKCLVEIAAWGNWAGQTKLLFARGGIDHEEAKQFFVALTKSLRGYDWVDDVLVEEE